MWVRGQLEGSKALETRELQDVWHVCACTACVCPLTHTPAAAAHQPAARLTPHMPAPATPMPNALLSAGWYRPAATHCR